MKLTRTITGLALSCLLGTTFTASCLLGTTFTASTASAATATSDVGARGRSIAAGASAPVTGYSRVNIAYSSDGQWKSTLEANTVNIWVYKKIGATAFQAHREWVCTGLFCWGGHKWQWVPRKAKSIEIYNIYTPYPPQYGNCDPTNPTMCAPSAPPRDCVGYNTASTPCEDYAGFITWPLPGPGAPLNIKGVRSTALIVLPTGDTIRLGPVDDSFGGPF